VSAPKVCPVCHALTMGDAETALLYLAAFSNEDPDGVRHMCTKHARGATRERFLCKSAGTFAGRPMRCTLIAGHSAPCSPSFVEGGAS
jgi:hypothetical protein